MKHLLVPPLPLFVAFLFLVLSESLVLRKEMVISFPAFVPDKSLQILCRWSQQYQQRQQRGGAAEGARLMEGTRNGGKEKQHETDDHQNKSTTTWREKKESHLG